MRDFGQFIGPFLPGIPAGSALARQRGHAAWQPPVDIFDVGDAFLVIVELPGVKDDQVRVSVEHGCLTISGHRAKPVPDGTLHVHQVEIPYGEFNRVLALPEEIDTLRISAEYTDGYLTVKIPRINNHD